RRQAERAVLAAHLEMTFELAVELFELFAPCERPVVVAVLWQQLAAVKRQRSSICGGRPRAVRMGCRQLKVVDVHPRVEREQLVASFDPVGTQYPACRVDNLVQVVSCRGRVAVRPQRIHQLLPVQAMARSKSQELHQIAALTKSPGRVGKRLASGHDGEAAKQ